MPAFPESNETYYRLGLNGIGKSLCISVHRYDGLRYLIASRGDEFGTRHFRCASAACRTWVPLSASDCVHARNCDSYVTESEHRLSVGRYILASSMLTNPDVDFSNRVDWRQEQTPFVDDNEYTVLKMFVDYWSVANKREQLKTLLEQKRAMAESLLSVYLTNVRQVSEICSSVQSTDDSSSESDPLEISSGDETVPIRSPAPAVAASEPSRKRTSVSTLSSSEETVPVSARRITHMQSKTVAEALATPPQSADDVHSASAEGAFCAKHVTCMFI